MKRSELTVGAELFHAKPGDWSRGQGSYPKRVRVLAVEPYRAVDFGGAPRKTSTGNGVYVDVLNDDGSSQQFRWGTGYVVQLAHLRGPYAETVAALDERNAAEAKQASEARTVREESLRQLDATVVRAIKAGLTTAVGDLSWHASALTDATVTVGVVELAALLDQLDELSAATDELIGLTDHEGD